MYRSRYSSYGSRWSAYVPVGARRAQAAGELASRRKSDLPASPVVLAGRAIATSFWGRSWCDTMESYGDFANRLARGRTYVRNGSVVDLQVQSGLVSAWVSGSRLYETTVQVTPLEPARWKAVVEQHAGQVSSLVDLLQGRLPASLLEALASRSSGLFPGPAELTFSCSCPDWAMMCKHVAAVLYGVGARLDHDPGLFFLLRGVEVSDLALAGANVDLGGGFVADGLAGADLGHLFGIDLEVAVPMVKPAKAKRPEAVEMVPVQASTLRQLGVGKRTVNAWLRAGVLLPLAEPDRYMPTPETSVRLREYLARRA